MNEKDERMLFFLLVLKRIFSLLCIFATLFMVNFQFYEFNLNSDETQVEYKTFNNGIGDPYPSIALCLTVAIYEDRLKEFGDNLTAIDYGRFLVGGNKDENMLKVDYEKVTTHWDEYILGYGYQKADQTAGYVDEFLYVSKKFNPTTVPKSSCLDLRSLLLLERSALP